MRLTNLRRFAQPRTRQRIRRRHQWRSHGWGQTFFAYELLESRLALTGTHAAIFPDHSDTIETADSPTSITAGDFNGDGVLDLATADILANRVSILLNVRSKRPFRWLLANAPTFSLPPTLTETASTIWVLPIWSRKMFLLF